MASTSYAPISISEMVPPELHVASAKAASVVKHRNKATFYPRGTSTYTVGGASATSNVIQFNLAADSWIDLEQAYLVFNYSDTTLSGIWDDNATALINRSRCLVNNQLVEDRYSANIHANMKIVVSADSATYSSGMNAQMGTWRYNATAYGGLVGDSAGIATRAAAANAQFTGNRSVVIPLQHLVGLFGSSQSFFPLKLVGSQGIQLEFYLEQVNTALYFLSAATGTESYTLANVRIVADLIDVDPEYDSIMTEVVMADPNGYQHVVDCVQYIPQSYTAVASGGAVSLLLSKPTQMAKKISMVRMLASDATSSTAASLTKFYNEGIANLQFVCGAVRFPASPLETLTEIAEAAKQAHAKPGQLVAMGGLANYGVILNGQGLVAAFNLAKVQNELVTADGFSTILNGAGVTTINFIESSSVAGQAMVAHCFLEYGRIIKIAGGAVSLIGQ